MNQFKMLLFVMSLTMSTQAYAWFFFFLPGSVTRSIGDAITGAKGNICVKEGTKEGDVINSPTGNTAKVLSVSGSSSICQNPALPIRAELEFTYKFVSKAGIELSDDYEAKPITDLERFNGSLMKAAAKGTANQGVIVSAIGKSANRDLKSLASGIENSSLKNVNFKEVKSQNPEQITIKGLPAVRWEIVATLKGLFGADVTYLYTIIEGSDEFVLINAYAPSSFFQRNKADLSKIAEGISGLQPATSLPTTLAANEQKASSPAPVDATDNGNISASQTRPSIATSSDDGVVKLSGMQQKSQALTEAQEVVSDNPDNVSSWNILGAVHLDEKSYEKASAAYAEALKRNPRNVDALFGLGGTYNAMGNKDKVREVYLDLKDYDSKQAASYFKKFLLP
jgi:tetratricopeptide (TPR) repeat protein